MIFSENRYTLFRIMLQRERSVKVLLTHTPEFRRQYYGERALRGLQALAEVKLNKADGALDANEIVEAARDVDIIVADRLTEGRGEIFPRLSNLRAFVRCAVDIRNIDVDAASEVGVLVTRAGPGFVQAVAELALGFMVDLSRGISRATADYHAGRQPEVRMGRQLAGSRIGIIGYGHIGRYLAQLVKVLGMEVLVTDPYATAAETDIRHVGLDELLALADYVVCLAVANEETESLMGQAAFARMQPHAFFINLSRGNLVDEAALAAALRENRIAGAAMDVGRARDQMPTAELAKLPNVIATPHIGGLTPQAIEYQALETVKQVEAILKGEVPLGAVNAAHWTRRPAKAVS
jgi:D-3-phosphoglycerate dehydrogenase / 2-oxoglutarate reductase